MIVLSGEEGEMISDEEPDIEKDDQKLTKSLEESMEGLKWRWAEISLSLSQGSSKRGAAQGYGKGCTFKVRGTMLD
jgi:hypothetical protein